MPQIQLLTTKQQARNFAREQRERGNTIGLIPTMGAIHSGHQSLVRTALEHADVAVASVFVNPTQFSPTEDFDAYPRTLETDMQMLEEAGASAVFAPSIAEMYGQAMADHILANGLTSFDFASHAVPGNAACLWEGADRPHHFAGVTTVVSKLFNIIEPNVACFGEKDYQQLAVLRQMVADMDFNLKIVGCPIVRESDGLAISSRNRYMTSQQRQRALALSGGLCKARKMFSEGCRDVDVFESVVKDMLLAQDIQIDYVAVVDATTLEPLTVLEGVAGENARMLIAARLENVRLIDNASLA